MFRLSNSRYTMQELHTYLAQYFGIKFKKLKIFVKLIIS